MRDRIRVRSRADQATDERKVRRRRLLVTTNTLESAMAGGAHVCVIPEITYRIEPLVEAVLRRKRANYPYSIVVVAEGAKPRDGGQSLAGPRELGAMPKLFGAGASAFLARGRG